MEKLIVFLLFVICQGAFIVGLKSTFEEKMILEKPAKWIRETLGEYWSKPFVGCIRCMSSVYGFITYWPAVLYEYGFHFWQVPAFIFDVFVLVYVTWFLYRKQ
jgi:hypothetical protein